MIKKYGWLVLLLISSGVFLALRRPNHYLEGYPLYLLDHIKEENVTPSGLFSTTENHHERQLRSWRFAHKKRNGITLWITEIPEPIRTGTDVQLFQEGKEVPRTDVFLESSTGWNQTDQHIWLALPPEEEPPNDSHLRYIAAETKESPEAFSENFTNEKILHKTGNRNIYFLSLPENAKHETLAVEFESENKEVRSGAVLTENIFKIPEGDPKIYRQSTHSWQTLLHVPETQTPMQFLRIRTFWKDVRHFLPGPVSVKVKAKTDLVGSEPPLLTIYIGKRRAGSIPITSTNYQYYTLKTFTSGGPHGLKFVVQNIQDPKSGVSRPVFVKRIDLEHHPGILISVPNAIRALKTNVSYKKPVPANGEPLHDLLAEHRRSKTWIESITVQKEVAGDMRTSIPLISGSKLEFPVHLPERASLRFSYHSKSAGCRLETDGGDLNVKWQSAWMGSETLFSKKLSGQQSWSEEEISLEKLQGKRGSIIFELKGDPFEECPVYAWVANPYISTGPTQNGTQMVVIFSADALRADHLGSYGYSRNTSPAIDRFARDSVLFTNAVSQAPWTLPSFASLFTSLYPSFHGAHDRDSVLSHSHDSLPEILNTHQFFTAGFTQNGFLTPSRGFGQGFDFYRGDWTEDKNEEERLQQILTWLERHRQRNTFLLVHFLEPHSPYTPPASHLAKLTKGTRDIDTSTERLVSWNQTGEKVSAAEREYLIDLYDAEISYLDSVFARFIQKLQQLKLYDSALIVFLSDHGEEFQDHGKWMHTTSLYQELVRVPLIIKFPAKTKFAGRRISSPVELIDIMPTILDYLKLKGPDVSHGRSLLPVIRNEEEGERVVLSERNDVRLLAFQKDSFKYIFDGRSSTQPKEELYNLQEDPQETRNLATTRPDLIQMFRKLKEEYLMRVKNYQAQRGASTPAKTDISQEEDEKLRALGYVQ